MVEALSLIFAINVVVGLIIAGVYVWRKTQAEKIKNQQLQEAKKSVTITPFQPPANEVRRVLVLEGTVRPKGPLHWLKSWGVASEAIADIAKIEGVTDKAALPPKVLECFEDLYVTGSIRGPDATKFAMGEKMEAGKSLYFVLLEPSPKDLRLLALIA